MLTFRAVSDKSRSVWWSQVRRTVTYSIIVYVIRINAAKAASAEWAADMDIVLSRVNLF